VLDAASRDEDLVACFGPWTSCISRERSSVAAVPHVSSVAAVPHVSSVFEATGPCGGSEEMDVDVRD
jgi:hypothetical protein